MRIRTQFLCMVVGITLIPFLLLGLGWTLFALNQNQESIPAYDQLPTKSLGLTNQAHWDKIRNLMAHRPGHSQAFAFDDAFQLIYSSVPFPGALASQALTSEKVLSALKSVDHSQDVFLLQPAGTQIWIAFVLDSRQANPWEGLVLFLGIVLSTVLLFVILFSIGMARNLTRSIIVLEKSVARLADGDLESRVDSVRGSNEIQALGRSFEQLRQSLHEEHARQSRFVMGVSHDLKSPMALIKGYVELLRDGPAVGLAARESSFDLILDKVDQLDGMIDHLIDFGKVNTGEWQQTWTEVPLQSFLEEFAQEVTPDARLLGRTMVTAIAVPEGLTVACDRRSVRRCLENLVNNALRYSEPGGTVGIGARTTLGAIEVFVWDDGAGISAEDLPHLFELFYRGTRSRREPGMGLGLAVVKTILESHGWSVKAESVSGARFTITIPA